MALIKSVRGFTPSFGNDCYLSENCTIVGDVIAGDNCSFWFSSVIRGDVNAIRLGDCVNIQDGAVIHCTYQKSQTIIGDNVSIGHNSVVHGCVIHSNVLIGMGAVIMDNATIHSGAIIAAGAVVLENQIVEANTIYGGVPAKKIKDVPRDTSQFYIERTAKNYLTYASWMKDNE